MRLIGEIFVLSCSYANGEKLTTQYLQPLNWSSLAPALAPYQLRKQEKNVMNVSSSNIETHD